MVCDGQFREDLWYRLNVLPIRIPPLRLRREDIPSLVQHFVERKARELSLANTPRVSDRALEALMRYDWPGNVRELHNIVERALILCDGDVLVFPKLGSPSRRPVQINARPLPNDTCLTMDEAIASHIRSTLARVNWQVAGPGGAAELLKMNPSTLRFRMKKLGINKRGSK